MRAQLCKLLRARRRELAWTQRELALVLGSSASRVSKMEGGDNSVSTDLMLRALRAMAVSILVTENKEADPLADPSLSSEQRNQLSRAMLLREQARRIAKTHGVDMGDVEHVLKNLRLSPTQRLGRGLQRGKLVR